MSKKNDKLKKTVAKLNKKLPHWLQPIEEDETEIETSVDVIKKEDPINLDVFQDLPYSMQEVIANIIALFASKNAEYRDNKHWASALLDGDPVKDGGQSPLGYATSLMAKQDKAARALIYGSFPHRSDFFASKGGEEMLKERLRDGIVYRIMMLALYDEWLRGEISQDVLF